MHFGNLDIFRFLEKKSNDAEVRSANIHAACNQTNISGIELSNHEPV